MSININYAMKKQIEAKKKRMQCIKIIREEFHSGGCASWGKSVGWHPLSAKFFYSKCITRKCLNLKIKVKVIEYNIYIGAIYWQINLCKSHMTHFCDGAHRFQDINVSNFLPKNLGQDHGELHSK